MINATSIVVRPLSNPIKPDSHLCILYGNLTPTGAVAKISGKEGLKFTGKAIVFEDEEHALQGILGGKVKAGQTVVFCALGGGIAWGSALVRW